MCPDLDVQTRFEFTKVRQIREVIHFLISFATVSKGSMTSPNLSHTAAITTCCDIQAYFMKG